MADPNSQDLLTSPVDPKFMPQPIIHAFPSRLTGTTTYIVLDPVTEEAAIINPVLDLDPFTNEIRTRSADRLLKFVNDEGLTIKFILETTLHRDRISACRYLQLMLKHIGDGVVPQVCIGENSFCTCGDDSAHESATASPPRNQAPSSPPISRKSPEAFDKLFDDNESFPLGNVIAVCTHLPSHQGVTYRVSQYIFSSGPLSRLDAKDPSQGITTHPEPPPDKATTNNNNNAASSRAPPTIDEVLGAAETSNGDTSSVQLPQQASQPSQPSPSPLLAFYAEQVNVRGGRIPRKINLNLNPNLSLPPPHSHSPSSPQRSSPSASTSNGDGQSAVAGIGGDENGSPDGGEIGKKGKEKANANNHARKSSLPASPSAAVMPLRIPRKLGGIMC